MGDHEPVIIVPPARKEELSQSVSNLRIQSEGCDGWEQPAHHEVEMLQAFLKGDKAVGQTATWMIISGNRIGVNKTGVYIHWNHHKRFFGIPRANASVALRLAVPEVLPEFSAAKADGSLLSKVMQRLPTINDEMRHQVLHAAFVSADLNRNGTLSRAELGTMMRRVVCFLRAAEVQDLLNAADINHDRKIQYTEFVQWVKQSAPERVQAALRKSLNQDEDVVKATFRIWDHNGDGLIAKVELRRVLHKLCKRKNFTPDQLTALVNVMDVDHNGKIDYDEFVGFLFNGSGISVEA